MNNFNALDRDVEAAMLSLNMMFLSGLLLLFFSLFIFLPSWSEIIAWLKLLFRLVIDFIIIFFQCYVVMADNLVAGDGCACM